ncbi:MAG: hypothetical protein LQ343_005588 [Gyalolechia ehrenbergii]|nr:MAG: hypothetical protein LQ343_005588 [Gyalolechia ehrenbergii]
MRLIIVFIIIGATAIAIPGVGGALVNAVESYGVPSSVDVAHDKTHPFVNKRENCREASNGQVQCGGTRSSTDGVSSTHADSSVNTATGVATAFNSLSSSALPADETFVSSIATATDLTTADDAPDENGTLATTCVHTSEGFLQCGTVMAEREDSTHNATRVATNSENHIRKRLYPNRQYVPGWGTCKVIYRSYFFGSDRGGTHARRCRREFDKGPAKWRKAEIDKCYSISDCLKSENHITKRQAPHRVEIPGELFLNRGVAKTTGWGTCDIFYRKYYYDNDSNETHASKCNNELKKGPAKWKKGLMLKCFDIPRGVCFKKRDAVVDPKYQTVDTTKRQKKCHEVKTRKPFCQFPPDCYTTKNVCD